MIRHSSWLTALCCIILVFLIDNSATSNRELSEELRFIHQEIGSLRDENHNQNLEIALLKERIGNADDQSLHHRGERPVRLLPPHLFYGEQKKETEEQKQINRRRYEQPTNCSDLSILGYTLNGFYMVKSNESNTNNKEIKIETVFCAFKQPEGTFNPSLVQKRIISRRDTTKSGSSMIKIFNATRNTDWNHPGNAIKDILFDVVRLNSAEAFYSKTGIFTIQKSGLYLFVFRCMIYFPKNVLPDATEIEEMKTEVSIYVLNNSKNEDVYVSYRVVINAGQYHYADFNTLVRGDRGDEITLAALSFKENVKFMSSNMSFTGYYLIEE